jgi:polyphosphate kinase 2 (PPK2 family)
MKSSKWRWTTSCCRPGPSRRAAGASGDVDRQLLRGALPAQGELVKLQDWVVEQKLKGRRHLRGATRRAGGAIKRITQRLNSSRVPWPRSPLGRRERSQWYFQRYVSHLPAGGEIVLFDRSW